jgi:hypothetical protein
MSSNLRANVFGLNVRTYGLDEGLALSGRGFGVDSERHAEPPVRLDEQELIPLTNRVTIFLSSPA